MYNQKVIQRLQRRFYLLVFRYQPKLTEMRTIQVGVHSTKDVEVNDRVWLIDYIIESTEQNYFCEHKNQLIELKRSGSD